MAANGNGRNGTRVTVSFPDRLLEAIEAAVEEGYFQNRSTAIRVACRSAFTDFDSAPRAMDAGSRSPLQRELEGREVP